MSPLPLGILALSGAGGAAGAYDLLETQVLTSAAASVTFTGLGSYSEYQHLQIRAVTDSDRGTTISDVLATFNGDTSTSYRHHAIQGSGSGVNTLAPGAALTSILVHKGSASSGVDFSAFVMDILDFSSTSKNTTIRSLSGNNNLPLVSFTSGLYFTTDAITSLTLTDEANFITNSRFSLYGIKGE
jgi:hypothetical protein